MGLRFAPARQAAASAAAFVGTEERPGVSCDADLPEAFMRRRIATTALLGAALAAGAAAAQAPTPAQAGAPCTTAGFPLGQRAFGASQVTTGVPTVLEREGPGCPGDSAACRQAVTVRAHTVVLTGRPYGRRYVCGFVPDRSGGGVAGWLRTERLKPLQVFASPPLRAWVGVWRKGDDRIEIVLDGHELGGVGHAWWPSLHAPDRKEARFSAQTRPSGNRIDFKGGAANDQTACEVSAVLVRDWIVVEDNGRCGDKPASFTGVYRRR
jgi:hypothetical protein